jgi:myo-inositol-1(or 4)-monophosphatase
MNYNELLLDAMSWAREAGAVHLRYFRGNELNIEAKLNASDIVTAADKAAERLLINHIKERYPEHSILSEESGADVHNGEYRWVIDPLDGTTNFSQGLPLFCVSIGIEHNGETVAGVVFAPYLNEMFHAVRGEGAYLNGTPIKVSGKDTLERSVVATGFPVDKAVNPDNNIDNVARIMPQLRGLRRLGSAAIDLCYVSAGFLDGYWEMGLHSWDVSAGLLILEEAGGEFTYFRADRHISVLAATPAVHDLLLPLLGTGPQ